MLLPRTRWFLNPSSQQWQRVWFGGRKHIPLRPMPHSYSCPIGHTHTLSAWAHAVNKGATCTCINLEILNIEAVVKVITAKNNGVFLLWPPGRQLNITLEGFMCERDWQASIFKPAVASSSNSHAYSMWCAPRIIYSTLVEKDERFTLCTCRKSSLLSPPCFLPLVVILLRVCVLKKQAVVDERATL